MIGKNTNFTHSISNSFQNQRMDRSNSASPRISAPYQDESPIGVESGLTHASNKKAGFSTPKDINGQKNAPEANYEFPSLSAASKTAHAKELHVKRLEESLEKYKRENRMLKCNIDNICEAFSLRLSQIAGSLDEYNIALSSEQSPENFSQVRETLLKKNSDMVQMINKFAKEINNINNPDYQAKSSLLSLSEMNPGSACKINAEDRAETDNPLQSINSLDLNIMKGPKTEPSKRKLSNGSILGSEQEFPQTPKQNTESSKTLQTLSKLLDHLQGMQQGLRNIESSGGNSKEKDLKSLNSMPTINCFSQDETNASDSKRLISESAINSSSNLNNSYSLFLPKVDSTSADRETPSNANKSKRFEKGMQTEPESVDRRSLWETNQRLASELREYKQLYEQLKSDYFESERRHLREYKELVMQREEIKTISPQNSQLSQLQSQMEAMQAQLEEIKAMILQNQAKQRSNSSESQEEKLKDVATPIKAVDFESLNCRTGESILHGVDFMNSPPFYHSMTSLDSYRKPLTEGDSMYSQTSLELFSMDAGEETKKDTKAKSSRRSLRKPAKTQIVRPTHKPLNIVEIFDQRIEEINVKLRSKVLSFREHGAKECGFIVGIDCTESNTATGKKSFGNRPLHEISKSRLNFYEIVLGMIGSLALHLTPDNRFPVFIFGDSKTTDKRVRPLYQDQNGYNECFGIKHAMAEYRKQIPSIDLSGPTSFKPIIRAAIEISEQKRQFQVLVIIGDGAVTNLYETSKAITEASNYPLVILMIGVGDGDYKQYPNDPWLKMRQLEAEIPLRKFQNFAFLQYKPEMSIEEFTDKALAAVSKAYKYCAENISNKC